MTKRNVLLTALVVALAAVAPAYGQFGGCADSPENPTLVLAGLATGAFAISSIRTRLRARRSPRKSEK